MDAAEFDSGHTPGPWRVYGLRVVSGARDGPEVIHDTVADVSHNRIASRLQIDPDPKRAAAAQSNARLIAAAPELLVALKDLLANACRPGDDGKYDDAFDAARAAARSVVLKATACCVACRGPASKAYLGRTDMPWCGNDKCGLRMQGGIDAHEHGCNR